MSDNKFKLLDLYSGAGGAAHGYQLAGFDVTGVDIRPQPRYVGDRFIQADALEYVAEYGPEYHAIHASPPCQAWCPLARGEHPRLIEPTRLALLATGRPWVIENGVLAPLRQPIKLCGSSFGLGVRRHRLFESNRFLLSKPCQHATQREIRAYYGKKGWLAWNPRAANVQARWRRPLLRGSEELAAADMGISWMTWDELREAVPPAYTHWIGTQLLQYLAVEAA